MNIQPQLTVPQGESKVAKTSRKPDYSWSTVEEYEKCSGFSVSDAFRIGWNMARTTDTMLGIEPDAYPSREPAVPQGEPVAQVSDLFPSIRTKLCEMGFEPESPLYTAPAPAQEPPRPQNCGTSYCSCIECVCEPSQPVTLTDDEILSEAAGPCWSEDGVDPLLFARAIIAALREKEQAK